MFCCKRLHSPEMSTISIFYVIVRIEARIHHVEWAGIQTHQQSPILNLPDHISSYLVFCWFSIFLTNLHQLENSMEQVMSIVSPKGESFENSFHVKPDISLTRLLSLSQWEQTDTVRRPETNNCVCAVWVFSWLNRKHYPDRKLIWLFKERWPLNSIFYI